MQADLFSRRVLDEAGLTDLEYAYGLTLGRTSIDPLAVTGDELPPSQALESVILEALQRPPCLISFSGGRDSSALLAVAARLARAEGLPLPIPVTNVFPAATDTHEDEWQDKVLDELKIDERVRLTYSDELGMVGPVARRFMHAYGPRWPFNAHMHLPIVELATGGSVITGFGGDEVGRSSQLAYLGRLLAKQRRARPGDVLPLVFMRLPESVRFRVHHRRAGRQLPELPWLSPAARPELVDTIARDELAEPKAWDRLLVEQLWQSRYLQLCLDTFDRMGRGADAVVVHPFVHPKVLTSLSFFGGPGGLGSRARVLKTLSAEALPDELFLRRTKADFTAVVWTEECRQFAAGWSGTSFDPKIINPDRLRREWLDPAGSVRSFAMLQAAWWRDQQASSTASATPR